MHLTLIVNWCRPPRAYALVSESFIPPSTVCAYTCICDRVWKKWYAHVYDVNRDVLHPIDISADILRYVNARLDDGNLHYTAREHYSHFSDHKNTVCSCPGIGDQMPLSRYILEHRGIRCELLPSNALPPSLVCPRNA